MYILYISSNCSTSTQNTGMVVFASYTMWFLTLLSSENHASPLATDQIDFKRWNQHRNIWSFTTFENKLLGDIMIYYDIGIKATEMCRLYVGYYIITDNDIIFKKRNKENNVLWVNITSWSQCLNHGLNKTANFSFCPRPSETGETGLDQSL